MKRLSVAAVVMISACSQMPAYHGDVATISTPIKVQYGPYESRETTTTWSSGASSIGQKDFKNTSVCAAIARPLGTNLAISNNCKDLKSGEQTASTAIKDREGQFLLTPDLEREKDREIGEAIFDSMRQAGVLNNPIFSGKKMIDHKSVTYVKGLKFELAMQETVRGTTSIRGRRAIVLDSLIDGGSQFGPGAGLALHGTGYVIRDLETLAPLDSRIDLGMAISNSSRTMSFTLHSEMSGEFGSK